jgi:tetratricopeptide (TPR) repeat protein
VRRGFVVQGIDYYKLALTIDARDWRVLFNIGIALEKLGHSEEALGYLERALAANDSLDKARRRIEWLKKNRQNAS